MKDKSVDAMRSIESWFCSSAFPTAVRATPSVDPAEATVAGAPPLVSPGANSPSERGVTGSWF